MFLVPFKYSYTLFTIVETNKNKHFLSAFYNEIEFHWI